MILLRKFKNTSTTFYLASVEFYWWLYGKLKDILRPQRSRTWLDRLTIVKSLIYELSRQGCINPSQKRNYNRSRSLHPIKPSKNQCFGVYDNQVSEILLSEMRKFSMRKFPKYKSCVVFVLETVNLLYLNVEKNKDFIC